MGFNNIGSMGGSLNYERSYEKLQKARSLSEEEKKIIMARKRGFPNCKGLYPDCPEVPDKNCSQCKTCPVLDETYERSYKV